MDGSTCANSVSEDIGCKSYVHSVGCEKSYDEHKQCTRRDTEGTVKITPQKALNASSCSEDGLIVHELGITLEGVLHIGDSHGKLPGPNATSDQDEICNSEEIGMPQEPRFCKSVSLDAKVRKGLSKCATFPCLEEVHSYPLSIGGREGLPSTSVRDQSTSKSESPAYARSISLPVSIKLVSAMKGGREQFGMPPNLSLRVKWAPDVRDPPASSMSHTVKNHNQRSKAKKKDHHKHKHNKGKSSRGNGSERKHAKRRSVCNITDPLDMRLQSAGERLILDGYVQSKVDVLDYVVSSQEAKCGSSFLRESLAKMQLSIAEAS